MFIGKIIIICLLITGCSNYKYDPRFTIIKQIIKEGNKNE